MVGILVGMGAIRDPPGGVIIVTPLAIVLLLSFFEIQLINNRSAIAFPA